MTCFYCKEEILPADEIAPGNLWVDGEPTKTHRECALRAVLGGIGHLEHHNYYCLTLKDPDAGHTYRESALLVDEWVRQHGTE